MFKEKWQGFKFLLSDKGLRTLTVLSFTFAALMLSVGVINQYYPNSIYPLVIGAGALLLFLYLVHFLIVFAATLVFKGVRDMKDPKIKRRYTWGLRAGTAGLLVVNFALIFVTGGFVLLVNLFLVLVSFIAWVFIASFYLAKFIHDLAKISTHRTLHLVVYPVIMGGYFVYLVVALIFSIMPGGQGTGIDTGGIDFNLIDWIISIVLFFFSMGTMGQRFMPRNSLAGMARDLPVSKEAKMRVLILLVLVFMLAFHIYTRGLNMLFALEYIETGATEAVAVGSITYNVLRIAFLVPFAGIFFQVLFFRRIKKGGKGTKKSRQSSESVKSKDVITKPGDNQ